MPAANGAASAVPCLRRCCMQQGRSQPGTSRRCSKTAAAAPGGAGSAGWCLAGCRPGACGPAAFLRQSTANAALLAAGMQACVGRSFIHLFILLLIHPVVHPFVHLCVCSIGLNVYLIGGVFVLICCSSRVNIVLLLAPAFTGCQGL